MASNWYEGASYMYETMPDKEGYTTITFTFPNAATKDLEVKTWLYRIDDGEVVDKNMTAEMLQCYMDLIFKQETK